MILQFHSLARKSCALVMCAYVFKYTFFLNIGVDWLTHRRHLVCMPVGKGRMRHDYTRVLFSINIVNQRMARIKTPDHV